MEFVKANGSQCEEMIGSIVWNENSTFEVLLNYFPVFFVGK